MLLQLLGLELKVQGQLLLRVLALGLHVHLVVLRLEVKVCVVAQLGLRGDQVVVRHEHALGVAVLEDF